MPHLMQMLFYMDGDLNQAEELSQVCKTKRTSKILNFHKPSVYTIIQN